MFLKGSYVKLGKYLRTRNEAGRHLADMDEIPQYSGTRKQSIVREMNAIDEGEEENSSEIRNIDQYQSRIDGKAMLFEETIRGVSTIAYFFYQIEALLRVNSPLRYEKGFSHDAKIFVSGIFNFFFIKISTLCPTDNLQPVGKEGIKVGLVLICFAVVLICYLATRWFGRRLRDIDRQENESDYEDLNIVYSHANTSCEVKMEYGFLKLLLFSYTPISVFAFKMINCVPVVGSRHLYIYGDVECYQWWQCFIILFIIFWIGPFAFALYAGPWLLRSQKINLRQFFLIMFFPFLSIYYFVRGWCSNGCVCIRNEEGIKIRRHLRTFTGPFLVEYWEVVIILRRLVLTALCSFIINPVIRLFITMPCLGICLAHHMKAMPYKSSKLNWLEASSLTLLCLFNLTHLFWAFTYMNDISGMPGARQVANFFLGFEELALILPLFLFCLCVAYWLLRLIHSYLRRPIVVSR